MSDEEQSEPRSRTALAKERKSDEKKLAQLAIGLVGLSSKQTAKIELHESVLDVIEEARRMRSHGARARQLRAVRRELRDNHDMEEVASALDDILNHRVRTAPEAHEAKRWIARFLDEGDKALQSFLSLHEQADRQRLRGMIRKVRKADAEAIPKTQQSLETLLVELIRMSPPPPPE